MRGNTYQCCRYGKWKQPFTEQQRDPGAKNRRAEDTHHIELLEAVAVRVH